MCAGLPLLFQHPGPVGCSPAVLHLCSEDPGALETEWKGGCYTVCVRKVEGGELEEKSGTGQTDWGVLDTVIGFQNAVSGKSDASTRVFSFRRACIQLNTSDRK